jgi:radical SAM superfamily enzyme YgiQ (UPF0313 family)
VFRAIADLRHPDLYFQCNLRATPISNEIGEALHRANCWLVRIGIESANQRVLDGIDKKVTVGDITKACGILKEHKINVYGFFMFHNIWEEGAKLLIESQKEVNRSLFFALKLRVKGLVQFISWSFPTPLPGSKLYDIVKRHNVRICSNNSSEVKSFHNICMILPGISKRAILLSRAKGLFLLGLLAVTSGKLFRGKLIKENMRHGFEIFKHILRSR